VLPSFPRLKRRGPIEATFIEEQKSFFGAFPRLKRRGPIEAVLDELNAKVIEAISTSEKAWPH